MTPGKLPVVLPQSMKLCTPKRKNNPRTQSLMIYVMELNMSCYCRDESTVQSTVDDHPQIVSNIIHVEIEIIIVIIWYVHPWSFTFSPLKKWWLETFFAFSYCVSVTWFNQGAVDGHDLVRFRWLSHLVVKIVSLKKLLGMDFFSVKS